ncbi:hypothetical protein ADU59_21395 [Pararhizobium polonicum]|uniref:HTH rpiR-type domain-containing protein n=1 Tax=Pararhizobium polonicum TaxID=1612624 RepID=A0A1C7NXI4_9HYPH|nr:hypothetical protein [Pararhizobium polonicum]OBZ93416.1 hypothetical protein ADU59_21395 [Pararhizobium polonicum]
MAFDAPGDGLPPSDLIELNHAWYRQGIDPRGCLGKVLLYCLSNPYDVAFASARRVAVQAGVSPQSVMRLIATLGFRQYSEYRRLFREELRRAANSQKHIE